MIRVESRKNHRLIAGVGTEKGCPQKVHVSLISPVLPKLWGER